MEYYEYEWTVDRRKKAQCWCFTLNNYTDAQVAALSVFGNSADVKYFVYGKEVGPECGTPHLQAFALMATAKTFVTMLRLLPFAQKLRPMYRYSKPHYCMAYCKKDGDFTEFGIPPLTAGVPGGSAPKLSKQQQAHADALEATSYKEACAILKKGAPRDWNMNRDALMRSMRAEHALPYTPKYKLDDFVLPPLDLSTPWLITGDEGIGKTQFALAHFKNPLLISKRDRLKGLTPEHDGIVFDDFATQHWPIDSVKHLLDIEEERDIDARFADSTIPAGTPRIFCHNRPNPFYVRDKLPLHEDAVDADFRAVDRRYKTLSLGSRDIRKPPSPDSDLDPDGSDSEVSLITFNENQ